MNSQTMSIQVLRQQLEEARSQNWGAEMVAFLKIREHPDLEWRDLLSALEFSSPTAEDAALTLHLRLGIPRVGTHVNRNRFFWETTLRSMSISPRATVGLADTEIKKSAQSQGAKQSLEFLRKQLALSRSQNLGREQIALLELLDHPDLEWNDLLDALACSPGTIVETAALKLHARLKIPLGQPFNRVIVEREFWEGLLDERGIKGSARFSD